MDKKYIIALDQGTTSSRAVIFNHDVERISFSQEEFTQYYPKPGWVEHDANELFNSSLAVIKQAINNGNIKTEEIAAIGITNQRETVVVWDKKTGEPVYHAIVWQCRRTGYMAEELSKEGRGDLIRSKTGLLPDPYFSATKIKWILDNVPGARERAEKGELLAGTVDTWIIWRLSGGKAFVSDRTNACRTMLYNIHTLDWDDDLLKMLDIPRCMLPAVADSSSVYAQTSADVCGFEVPIASAIGDQQAALFGQCCFDAGETKVTYGTGCFLLMNTGEVPVMSRHKLLTTIALSLEGKVTYALEGSVFMGGAVIKWLRDELGLIKEAHECDELAESVEDANGAIIVPAFTGLGAPYWDSYARGIIAGLTRGVKKAHICRAALEAIALQVKDVIDCMRADASSIKGAVPECREAVYRGAVPECREAVYRGADVSQIKVDGGACVSDVMMQFQADIVGGPVCRPKNIETTVMGAVFLAGLAVGFWRSTDELKACWKEDKTFTPHDKHKELCDKWNKAVMLSEGWAK